jgi:hypothetical protein
MANGCNIRQVVSIYSCTCGFVFKGALEYTGMEDRIGRGYPYYGNVGRSCTKLATRREKGRQGHVELKYIQMLRCKLFGTHYGILLIKLSR